MGESGLLPHYNTMFRSQQKLQSTQTRKCGPFTRKKKHLTEIIPEDAQNLELVVKHVKSAVLNMLKGIPNRNSRDK